MRTSLFLLLFVLVLDSFASAAAARDYKSAKECNDEIRQRHAELARAGESLRDFVEDCWWHSKPGTATLLRRASPKEAPREATEAPTPQKTQIPVASLRMAKRRIYELTKRDSQLAVLHAAVLTRKIHARSAYLERLRHRRFAQVEMKTRFAYAPHNTVRSHIALVSSTRLPSPYQRPDAPVAGVINARRAWVRQAWIDNTGRWRTKLNPAILLGASVRVERGDSLRCWSQPILLWNRRQGTREMDSSVCAPDTMAANTTLVAYRD